MKRMYCVIVETGLVDAEHADEMVSAAINREFSDATVIHLHEAGWRMRTYRPTPDDWGLV